jgi:hypothetical protein
MNKKEIGYGLAGLGSALLAYYIYTRSHAKPTSNTTTPQTTTPNTVTGSTTVPQPTAQTTPSSCDLITPDNFSQSLLAQCFGGSLTSCGLYEPLISKNGFCEAYSPSTNYSVDPPNIKSGYVVYNSTNGFFGLYWAYPGTFGGTSPCYCSGSTQVFPSNQTGAFFDFIGLVMPKGYTWLPTYYFPSSGVGFLTYEGSLWYSPNFIFSNLSYIKENNIVYTVKLPGTPDTLGYTVNTFTTPADTGGSLCFNYASLNSNFCIAVAPNQTIPFWANSHTTVSWCPANNAPNCQTVY